MSIVFWIIFLYLLYRFIFGFLIPVIGASRQMRMKVRQMQEQMNQAQGYDNTTSRPQQSATNKPGQSAPSKGDYIDFEEVK